MAVTFVNDGAIFAPATAGAFIAAWSGSRIELPASSASPRRRPGPSLRLHGGGADESNIVMLRPGDGRAFIAAPSTTSPATCPRRTLPPGDGRGLHCGQGFMNGGQADECDFAPATAGAFIAA